MAGGRALSRQPLVNVLLAHARRSNGMKQVLVRYFLPDFSRLVFLMYMNNRAPFVGMRDL